MGARPAEIRWRSFDDDRLSFVHPAGDDAPDSVSIDHREDGARYAAAVALGTSNSGLPNMVAADAPPWRALAALLSSRKRISTSWTRSVNRAGGALRFEPGTRPGAA